LVGIDVAQATLEVAAGTGEAGKLATIRSPSRRRTHDFKLELARSFDNQKQLPKPGVITWPKASW
jgi:hypothetical protein